MKYIKRAIIRWALNQVREALIRRPNVSFATLEKIGIIDFSYNEQTKEYTITI